MALVDSLLTAMVRANGDALVMHVGEKPIVVAGSKTIDLSTHGLNLGAMVGMLNQLLSGDAQASLAEFGAVEHHLPSRGTDHFTVVAARGGDDIWIEIRRRRDKGVVPAAESPVATAPAATPAPVTVAEPVVQRASEAAEAASSAGSESISRVEPAPVPAAVAEVPEDPAASSASGHHAQEPMQGPASAGAPSLEPPSASDTPILAAPIAEAPSQAPAAEVPVAEVPVAEAPVGYASIEDPVAEGSLAQAPVAEAPISEPPVAEVSSDAGPLAALPEREAASTVAPHSEAPVQAPPAAGEGQVELEPAVTELSEQEPVIAGEAGPLEEEAAEAGAPVEAIAAPLAAAVPMPEAVPMMAAAGAARYSDAPITTPMVPMDFIPPTPAAPAPAAAAPSTSTPPPAGGSAAGGTEPPSTPVTRTVRIEVPARSGPIRATDRLLRTATGQAASELFLMSQARPYIRVDGEIRVLDDETPLQAADVESMLVDLTPEPWRDAVRRGDPAEWLMEFADVGRVRCSTFRDHRGPGAIFHFTATQAATADQLGLDASARLLATEPDGLVVVSGPSGSDKSAIVAAFVDIINRHRGDYVITLEPQVRVIHEQHQALISQREAGTDADRGLAMARAALRENPDVLVLEDVSSGEIVSLALDAAGNGRLAIVSLEAGSTADAVQRLIELVPAERRSDARRAMGQSFRGAVAQLLLRKASGGRIAAREVLIGTSAVARVVAEGPLTDLSATLDAGRTAGMAPMVDALVGYVQAGVVDVREAFRRAPDQARLMAGLKAAGVDTAAIDRLA